MRDQDIVVPARYYLLMGEQLARKGIDIPALLSRVGLSSRSLEQPDAMLRFSQVERLVEMAYEVSGRSDLAFDLGTSLSPATHSVVGFGMLNSPNVERGLMFLTRFFRLVMPAFAMRYIKHAAGVEIIFTPAVGMSRQCLEFHIEAIATAAYREIQDLCGGNMPTFRVELSMREPQHRHRYSELNKARWYFEVGDKPSIHVFLDYDVSQYPLAMADMNAMRVAEARCRSMVNSVARQGSFKDWTRMMLRESGEGIPSLSELAAVLNLSQRTLDRYLKREGTGFRELAALTQHELACERLDQSQQSITEIAHSLGFHNAANFTRAFKARSGCSPREFRERTRG